MVSVYRSNILCFMYCVINNGFIVIVSRFLFHFPLSDVRLYLIYKSFLEFTELPEPNVMHTLNSPQTMKMNKE
jgi:branched-subunit amino acid transport protein